MSYYCHEDGVVKIPGVEWKGLREALADAFNAHQRSLLEAARQLHARLAELKRERGRRVLNDTGALETDATVARVLAACHDGDVGRLWCAVLADAGGGKRKLTAPTKGDFPEVSRSRNDTYRLGGFSIVLDKDEKTLTWSVQENNHAIETARDHPLARALFTRLAKVRWLRGTGGVFVGNDEYTRDSGEVGGAANYVTARYGPLGERDSRLRGQRKRTVSPGRHSTEGQRL